MKKFKALRSYSYSSKRSKSLGKKIFKDFAKFLRVDVDEIWTTYRASDFFIDHINNAHPNPKKLEDED